VGVGAARAGGAPSDLQAVNLSSSSSLK
jgi:hypothetical protein